MRTDHFAQLRLFQLVSPSLPTGGFTYSQGLEYAVECGWVHDQQTLLQWLSSIMHTGFAELEIPLIKRLCIACGQEDLEGFNYWGEFILASRETSELRQEEKNRGRAMSKIIAELVPGIGDQWLAAARQSQVAGFALAAVWWNISLPNAAVGYVWSWLENMVMAAVKIVPLGQTIGQQVLLELDPLVADVIEMGLSLPDDEIAGSCPMFALGSCMHETQYTRLFRS